MYGDSDIIDHHHHDNYALFPDFNRTIPFETGTSILYHYLDYCFINNTRHTYQLLCGVDEEYLWGELCYSAPRIKRFILNAKMNIPAEKTISYRNNIVYRTVIDKKTKEVITKMPIKVNRTQGLYDSSELTMVEERRH